MADECGGDARESEEVLRLAFVAAVQASAPCQPGHGAFDNPAVSAQSVRGFDAFAGDAGCDAALAEPSSQVVVVVTLVAVELGRLAATRSAP